MLGYSGLVRLDAGRLGCKGSGASGCSRGGVPSGLGAPKRVGLEAGFQRANIRSAPRTTPILAPLRSQADPTFAGGCRASAARRDA